MYSVTGNDRVETLDDLPQPDFGAPHPIVLARAGVLYLAYFVSDPIDWDDPHALDGRTADELENELVALITFEQPYAHYFGAPNDETVGGHPLADRGLQSCTIAEVKDSSWITALVEMNSVHMFHDAAAFDDLRHFVFSFKDDFFECVAVGCTVDAFRGSMTEALARMTAGALRE